MKRKAVQPSLRLPAGRGKVLEVQPVKAVRRRRRSIPCTQLDWVELLACADSEGRLDV